MNGARYTTSTTNKPSSSVQTSTTSSENGRKNGSDSTDGRQKSTSNKIISPETSSSSLSTDSAADRVIEELMIETRGLDKDECDLVTHPENYFYKPPIAPVSDQTMNSTTGDDLPELSYLNNINKQNPVIASVENDFSQIGDQSSFYPELLKEPYNSNRSYALNRTSQTISMY